MSDFVTRSRVYRRLLLPLLAVVGIVSIATAVSAGGQSDETSEPGTMAPAMTRAISGEIHDLLESDQPIPPPDSVNGVYEKPPESELMKLLSSTQFIVTQQDGTEWPFQNEYWDNKEEGIYVDIVSGEPLFSSLDKYRSGTGWPSFTQPLAPGNIVEVQDMSYAYTVMEVRSYFADSHLGHVFNDGPAPTGLRYCMNSASMKFVPVAELAKEGYGVYLALFGDVESDE